MAKQRYSNSSYHSSFLFPQHAWCFSDSAPLIMIPLMKLPSLVSPLITILPVFQSTLIALPQWNFPQLPLERFVSNFDTYRYHVNQPLITYCLVCHPPAVLGLSPHSANHPRATHESIRHLGWRKGWKCSMATTMELRGTEVSILNRKSQGGCQTSPFFLPFRLSWTK